MYMKYSIYFKNILCDYICMRNLNYKIIKNGNKLELYVEQLILKFVDLKLRVVNCL